MIASNIVFAYFFDLFYSLVSHLFRIMMRYFFLILVFTFSALIGFGCSTPKIGIKKYRYWDDPAKLKSTNKKGVPPTKEESLHLLLANIYTRIDEIDYPSTCTGSRN